MWLQFQADMSCVLNLEQGAGVTPPPVFIWQRGVVGDEEADMGIRIGRRFCLFS